MELAIWLPLIYKISDLVSVNFAKSNFFREIWRISLITISRVLSNTSAAFEAQFMKRLSNTEAELKKALPIKKRAIHFEARRWKTICSQNQLSMLLTFYESEKAAYTRRWQIIIFRDALVISSSRDLFQISWKLPLAKFKLGIVKFTIPSLNFVNGSFQLIWTKSLKLEISLWTVFFRIWNQSYH